MDEQQMMMAFIRRVSEVEPSDGWDEDAVETVSHLVREARALIRNEPQAPALFNDDELDSIASNLRIAASHYEDNARELRAISHNDPKVSQLLAHADALKPLAIQFDRQADEMLDFALRIENRGATLLGARTDRSVAMSIRHYFSVQPVEMTDSTLFELVTPDGERVATASTDSKLRSLEADLNIVLTEAAEADTDVVINLA